MHVAAQNGLDLRMPAHHGGEVVAPGKAERSMWAMPVRKGG